MQASIFKEPVDNHCVSWSGGASTVHMDVFVYVSLRQLCIYTPNLDNSSKYIPYGYRIQEKVFSGDHTFYIVTSDVQCHHRKTE